MFYLMGVFLFDVYMKWGCEMNVAVVFGITFTECGVYKKTTVVVQWDMYVHYHNHICLGAYDIYGIW